jgi:hypothetical protein
LFIGHYGAGYAGKKFGKHISLGTLFMAAQLLDLIWPIFLIIGIEHVSIHPGDTKMTPLDFDYYPFSHSLLFVIIWAVLFSGLYYINRRNFRNSLILGILVISHWVLDLIVHRPDLPIFIDGPFVGLGLWNIPPAAIALESLIFIIGVYLYFSCTKPKDKTGTYASWGLALILIIIYIMNLLSPPPPDAKAIGYTGLALWLLVLWAYWADRHREIV